MNIINRDGSVRCGHCQRLFQSYYDYKEHICKNIKWKCPICGGTEIEMCRHRHVDGGKVLLSCKNCTVIFEDEEKFNQLRIYHGVKDENNKEAQAKSNSDADKQET